MSDFTHIYHIADIHIHKKIHDRLIYAWDELMNHIKKHEGVPLLVIAGDVFEYKKELTGTDIDVFKYMVRNIEKNKIQTLIIPGNHDFSTSDSDLISSNLELIKTKYIEYVKESCIFECRNIAFYIHSPIDKQILEVGDEKLLKIAIAHEPLRGCIFDNSMISEVGRFDKNDFAGYDITILGDIHKPQFLTPRVAYSGSFVQKNRGEGLNHGFILWDLTTCAGNFVKLSSYMNDVVIKTSHDVITELPVAIQPKSVIFEHHDCSEDFLQKFSSTIKETYGRLDTVVNTTIHKINASGDTQSANYLEDALAQSSYNDTEKTNIMEIHNKYSDCIKRSRVMWELLYLQWENIYKYIQRSCIDFTRCQGVTMLCGENAIGKSSIINILIYILYGGKTGVTTALAREFILNKNNTKNGQIKCGFRVENSVYEIHRIIRRNDPDTVSLYCDGNLVECGDINDTYAHMADLIGTRDTFLAITVAMQARPLFVDLSPKDKLAFMSKILGIDNLVSVVAQNKKVISELKRSTKDIASISNSDTNQLQLEYNKYSAELTEVNSKIKSNDDHRAEINSRIKELRSTMVNVNYTLDDCLERIEAANLVMRNYGLPDEDIETEAEICAQISAYERLSGRLYSTVKYMLDKGDDIDHTLSLEEILANLESIEMPLIPCVCNDASYKYYMEHRDEMEKILAEPIEEPTTLQYAISITEPHVIHSTKEYCVEQLHLVKNSKPVHGIEEVRAELLRLPADKTSFDVFDIDACETRISEYGRDISQLKHLIMRFKSDSKIDIQLDINMEIIQQLVEKFDNLSKQIIRVEPLIESCEAQIKSIDNTYKEMAFAESCCECTKNKRVIESINGKEKLMAELNGFISQKKQNEYIRKCLETTKCEIYTYGTSLIVKTEAELIELVERKNAYNNYMRRQTLEKKLETLLTEERNYAKKVECEKQIRQHDENAKLFHNQKLIKHYEKFKKYKEAQQVDAKIKYDAQVQFVRERGNKYYKFVSMKITYLKRKLSLSKARREFEKFTELLNHIHQNEQISGDVKSLQEELGKYKNLELNITRDELIKIIGQIEGKLESCLERDEKLNEINMELYKSQLYDTAMSDKKGIIGHIIKKSSERISEIWNSKLGKIVDFKVDIVFNKDKFNVMIVEDALINAEAGSGFQKFIMDLTFRETIYELAQINLGNFIMIDEGFGTADANNRQLVNDYLKSLTSAYPFIFIISHIDEMKSSADCVLTIDSKNGSCIRHGELVEFVDVDGPVKMDKSFIKEKIALMEQCLIDANNFNEIMEFHNFKYTCKLCERELSNRNAAIKHCNTLAHLTLVVKQVYSSS